MKLLRNCGKLHPFRMTAVSVKSLVWSTKINNVNIFQYDLGQNLIKVNANCRNFIANLFNKYLIIVLRSNEIKNLLAINVTYKCSNAGRVLRLNKFPYLFSLISLLYHFRCSYCTVVLSTNTRNNNYNSRSKSFFIVSTHVLRTRHSFFTIRIIFHVDSIKAHIRFICCKSTNIKQFKYFFFLIIKHSRSCSNESITNDRRRKKNRENNKRKSSTCITSQVHTYIQYKGKTLYDDHLQFCNILNRILKKKKKN